MNFFLIYLLGFLSLEGRGRGEGISTGVCGVPGIHLDGLVPTLLRQQVRQGGFAEPRWAAQQQNLSTYVLLISTIQSTKRITRIASFSTKDAVTHLAEGAVQMILHGYEAEEYDLYERPARSRSST